MKIQLPEVSLVVLIGASGSGKSSFARKHFKPTEVLCSDTCRGFVADDENDQSATSAAFDVLHFIAGRRLAAGRLTVVDATNVQADARKPLIALAREHDCLPAAIVFNLDTRVCQQRNKERPDRQFGPHVVRQQAQQLRHGLKKLRYEGFRHVTVLNKPEEVEAVEIERTPLWNNLRHEHGPFDIIGDVHGCCDELIELLARLGYAPTETSPGAAWAHPEGRKAVFLGDLADRGPRSLDVLKLVMAMVIDGHALCVPGNHDTKLLRKLQGHDVRITHGLAGTLEQLEAEPEAFKSRLAGFLEGLISHYVLDDGRLVVAHAGLKESYQGRASARVREFCLYGETTGETDAFGLPERFNWAADYRGRALVVYGHTPVPEAEWVNQTICIDTGCVFGGKLTALRFPERELVEVAARQTYYESARPFLPDDARPPALEQRPYNDLLDITDVQGKRIITTRVRHTVTIHEENSISALEVMSRFAVSPNWLIYLPPTMSPSETCKQGPYLEHPSEAFAYFRTQGVPLVVCEEKHMGSRAIVVLCRDLNTASRRFGVADGRLGQIYTRTGRPFFNDALQGAVLEHLHRAVERAGFWGRFASDWFCLDTELMPWSVKAQELLRTQYAAVGASSKASLGASVEALEQASVRTSQVAELLARFRDRREAVERYIDAYRHYCWPVKDVADLKIAPFHLLASEGHVHTDQNHVWHMETLAELCAQDASLLLATPFKVIDVTDPKSEGEGIAWWEALTSRGGEGIVVKPMDWVVRGRKGLVQPAIKCRGREYLRIIYGPEYAIPEHLDRLRARGLGRKRSLALREFALGLEALHRFADREPLYRVHECAFGVLALESEPVDPRL